jgi:hypothetical protein
MSANFIQVVTCAAVFATIAIKILYVIRNWKTEQMMKQQDVLSRQLYYGAEVLAISERFRCDPRDIVALTGANRNCYVSHLNHTLRPKKIDSAQKVSHFIP